MFLTAKHLRFHGARIQLSDIVSNAHPDGGAGIGDDAKVRVLLRGRDGPFELHRVRLDADPRLGPEACAAEQSYTVSASETV